MVLEIETFTNPGAKGWRPGNNVGGSSLFKALGHPLVAAKAKALRERLAKSGPVAVYDPANQASCFDAFYGLTNLDLAGVFVQKVEEAGSKRMGREAKLVTALAQSKAKTVLVAAFDSKRLVDQIRALVPAGAEVVTFDELRLPDDMISNPRNYLDPINFATNFGFLRDSAGDHTAISSANYWSGYGAKDPELWLCLFDEAGAVLAEWREKLNGTHSVFSIASGEVRKRFGLGDFTGSLFIHAVRVAGHDVVKYALDVESDDGLGLSCTHDANAWPADLYAGVPAPKEGERVLLWIQNSHPVAIPAGGIGANIVGSQDISWSDVTVPPFGTKAIDLGALLPQARWPNQIEIQAGRYFVRPRYEVVRDDGRRRIAHANVERRDLAPDPRIPALAKDMGKGYIMPLPVLPLAEFRSELLPTPMSTCQHELPLAAALYDASGAEAARKYLGRIARRDSVVVDVAAWMKDEGAKLPSGFGHVEFTYDFRAGGEADGWLHAFGRYQHAKSGHVAETIFGAHIYNTPIVYKDEPQSYAAKPPGLSTRIFLRLGKAPLDTLCHLIYPASLPWHAKSATTLSLCDRSGKEVAKREIAIPCGGSLFWRYKEMFEAGERERAGENAYVLVVDPTCRLFGFHGLMDGERAFSFDHMFGF
jgi:hypothetical protein